MMEGFYHQIKIGVFLFLIIIINILLVHLHYRPKFKDVTVELGTKEVQAKQFVTAKLYEKGTRCKSDLEHIDLGTIGEHSITLSYGGKEETVKLHVVDTTPPEVEFLDLEEGPNYSFHAEDFVKVARDESNYTIKSITELGDLTVGSYKVIVVVEDDYGNKTARECRLNINLVHAEITHELGEKLEKSEILIDEKVGSKELTNSVLSSVNTNEVGEYEIKFSYKEKEYKTKVTVKDTKGPDITVNNLKVYIGSKAKKNEDFLRKVTDPSGVKDVRYEGKLDYSKLGEQKLKIIATDNLGNTSTATATLTVKKDDEGPVFSGLKDITIRKNESINYEAGVKAVDRKDGNCSFTVDSSKVHTNETGTYYAIYKASDASNNTTTKKRKITVLYDSTDVDKMFDEYFDKHLKGKSVLQIVKYVKKHIDYTHRRGSDPLYIALTQHKGSCYGHALFVKKALDKMGIKNYMVETTNKTHFWNLVYENGKWRHYDSTPGEHIVGPATDKEKLHSRAMAGRKWDTSKYPAAN